MEKDTDKQLDQSLDEPESQTSDLEVGVAKSEDLTEQDIAALAESLVASTFDLLNVKAEESRMTIKDRIQKLRDKARATLPKGEIVAGWSQKVADLVYPGYTRNDFVQGYQNRIRRLLAAGELVVGKSNGRVVGMIGFGKWGDHEGREVYETTKGTILPEFCGKGLYTKIKEAAMSHLMEAHPGCPIMTVTKNPMIIGHMRKHFPGTQEIPLGADHPLAKELQKQIGEPEFGKMVSKGNVILWYDPETSKAGKAKI